MGIVRYPNRHKSFVSRLDRAAILRGGPLSGRLLKDLFVCKHATIPATSTSESLDRSTQRFSDQKQTRKMCRSCFRMTLNIEFMIFVPFYFFPCVKVLK